jgi:hypothetical protein
MGDSPSPIRQPFAQQVEPASPSKSAQPSHGGLTLKSPLQQLSLDFEPKGIVQEPVIFVQPAPLSVRGTRDINKTLSEFASKSMDVRSMAVEPPLIDSLKSQNQYQGLGPDPYFLYRTYQEHSSSHARKYSSPIGTDTAIGKGVIEVASTGERVVKSFESNENSAILSRSSQVVKMRESNISMMVGAFEDRFGRSGHGISLNSSSTTGGGSSSRKKKKGILFYPSQFILNKLVTMMQTSVVFFKTDLLNFKIACLNDSAVLFENHEIQIGVKSYRSQDTESLPENSTKMILFFTNKLHTHMEKVHMKLLAYGKNGKENENFSN